MAAADIAPGTGVEQEHFWESFASILEEMVPRNRELLAKRDDIQVRIDDWHRERAGQAHDEAAYLSFLKDIGYLLDEGEDFEIATSNVDPEIALKRCARLVSC